MQWKGLGKLQLMEAIIISLKLHEFLMISFFHFSGLVNNYNAIRILDRRKPVCYDQRCSPMHERPYAVLDHLLGS